MSSLRAAVRRTRRRTAGALVAGYLGYAAMSLFTPALVARKAVGAFTVGLLIGCAQIAVAVVIVAVHASDTAKHIDPLTDEVRATRKPTTQRGTALGELPL